MKMLLGFVLAGGVGAVQAGALEDCSNKVTEPARLLLCLRQAREAATDDMLEHFLGVEQAIAALNAAQSGTASAALKQSQRAFERYVLDHCHGVQSLLAPSEVANLACETDLLRQRASALEALELKTDRI